MGIPPVISLIGGIGDHLEVISMLLEWSRMDSISLILQVTPQRQLALTPLIAPIHQLALSSSVNPRAIPGMAMREWICRHYGSIRYRTWITKKFDNKETLQGSMYCWKAKGENDPLSAYLRSVPFHLVLNYYKMRNETSPKATLLDISDWNSEETNILQKAGVQCINPRDIGLNGLLNKCRGNQVITIDTALAHLCAATGINATLLLNYIPDERWKELHQKDNCYGQYLTVLQQTQFCDWDSTLSSLLNCASPFPGRDTAFPNKQ